MLFVTTYRIRSEVRDAAIDRFLKSGGQPPAGVQMIGRWHDIAGRTGLSVVEASDATLLAKWALEWTDLMDLETRSVINDEQAGPLLAASRKT